MWQSFVCAMTAAVMLQAFDPFRSGKLVLYQVTYSTGWHGFEMVPFAILGVLGVCFHLLIELTFLTRSREYMEDCSLK
jgi:H+/Cl- antiporter ClcA